MALSSSRTANGKQAFKACRTAHAVVRRPVQCHASSSDALAVSSRRAMLLQTAGAALALSLVQPSSSIAAGLPPQTNKLICAEECLAKLDSLELVTLPSGLQYRDIVPGNGPSPPVGYQVVVDYVAMTPNGRVFESSLDRGAPYDIRVGSGQVVPGLDEGIRSMKVGGVRRLYIPGNLAFPQGLKAAAGRPSVPANTPVLFDVELLYIPGLEVDE